MKRHLVLWLLLAGYLIGCDIASTESLEQKGCKGEDCLLVYDGVEYHTFDTKLMARTGRINDKENEFQYRLYNNDEYITSGNSITNQFRIMKRVNERLETVYEHNNDQEGIFPFAFADDRYIFSVMDYSNESQKFVGLFYLNGKNKLEKLQTAQNEQTDKIFGIGISTGNSVYTLLYEDGVQNLYRTNPALTEFELVAEEVNQNISTYQEKVCYVKSESMYCGDGLLKEFKHAVELAWVVSDKYILSVDDTGNYQLIDIEGGKVRVSGKGFIGFEEKPSELMIFSDGKLERVEG
ncbi:hypothetical protein LC085_20965 [Bacillus tianshenii]|uniref:hypothetical protein n=1 Tax=Sutcliffiella tianshenii TaxID=1463404 RepID=UPI001CD6A714|nr:hypothetical protein [Bacillus tianshenii]MCA1322354.1 hypothetical protein [Bacillus tianshenii]